jgi:CRP-like cAMP-binding protein
MKETSFLDKNESMLENLRSIDVLEPFEEQELYRLLEMSKIRKYKAGEIILEEGRSDTWLYFLILGRIRITKKGKEICVLKQKGEIFGEMRIIDSMKRSASVHAVGKTICLAIDTSAKNRISDQDPMDEKLDFLLLLYRIFAEYMSVRLRLTNEELITSKKKIKRLLAQI